MSIPSQQLSTILDGLHHEVVETMDECLTSISSANDEDKLNTTTRALAECAERIELLGMSAATTGMMGLMDVCMLFKEALLSLVKANRLLSDEEFQTLSAWAPLVHAYLTNPNDAISSEILIAYLQDISWDSTISDIDTDALRELLTPEEIEIEQVDSSDSDENNIAEETTNTNQDDSVQAGVSEQGLELVSLVYLEIEASISILSELLFIAASSESDIDARQDSINQYTELLERFSLASETVGLEGLKLVFTHIHTNILALFTDKQLIAEDERDILDTWPQLTLEYLQSLSSQAIYNKLLNFLKKETWPVALDEIVSQSLAELLASPVLVSDEEEMVQRQTEAHPEDVSLELPDDVNPQLLESLLQELPQHTADFSEAISHLLSGKGSLADVDKAQRVAHTLKGSANTVGVTGLASLPHHIEDILIAFTKHERLPGKGLADVLMNAADVLEMMSEALLGLGPAPEHAQNVLQQILHWANLIDQEGIPEDDALPMSTEEVDSRTDDDVNEAQNTESTASAMLRVPTDLIDELLRIVSESIITNGQLQDRLRQAAATTQYVRDQNKLFQKLTFELEQLVDIQGVSLSQTRGKLQEKFDSLELNQYNELHTVTRRLVEAASDAHALTESVEEHLQQLDSMVVDQEQLHLENQNVVMRTRMVPVQNIVPRLQRSIRQTCRVTSKQVELDVTGVETLMDSDVLNDLVDPLMHILRNAVDHGIETPEERQACNKDSTGLIKLHFYREGDQIVTRCEDDGAGLNMAEIRNTAISKGLLDSDDEVSDEQLTRMILLPGFTTRQETTQTSGRGIGMDAVNSRIQALKGSLQINSRQGSGCTFEVRLPLSMITVHGLLVRLQKQVVAISNRGIEQIIYAGDGYIYSENEQLYYHLDDEVYEAHYLEELLHLPADKRHEERQSRPVLLVIDDKGASHAISVEQVLANQDMVIKQLGEYIPPIDGIEGVTILGDGSVAPVVDLPGILRSTLAREMPSLLDNSTTENSDNTLPTALVVDDSLSARRSLTESLEDAGYQVRTSIDGLDAIDIINSNTPDILITDLEMPRMNGLELASHVRANEATMDLPIIMITSRSTEKHRQQAESAGVNVYLIKPFSDDELHENVETLLNTVSEEP